MAYLQDEHRPNKLAVQRKVEEYLRGAKVILTLPSRDCLNLKRWIAEMLIGDQAFIIAAEYKKEWVAPIKAFLERHFPNRHHLHVGDICEMDLKAVVAKSGKIDFADFDFCGQLTEKIARWMGQFKGCFKSGSRIFWTLTTAHLGENNRLYKHYEEKEVVRGNALDVFYRSKPEADGYTQHSFVKAETDGNALEFLFNMTYLCTPYEIKPLMEQKYNDKGHAGMYVFGFKVVGDKYSPDYNELLPKNAVKTQEWAIIGCDPGMKPALKASAVLRAKHGIRPAWLSPAKWAWNPLNPNGNKRKV